MPETDPETLLAYLRRYGERYSPAALRDFLVREGHDAVAVDAALAAYLAERGPEKEPTGEVVIRVIAGLILGAVGLAILLVGGCFGGYVLMMAGSPGQKAAGLAILAVTVGVFLLFAGLTLTVTLRSRRKSRERKGYS